MLFERQMMIAGLQKQYSLLASLIQEIESIPRFQGADLDSLQERSKRIANNLRRLRKIKSDYFSTLS